MSLDVSLLQILKHRKEYNRLNRTVNERAIDQRTAILLSDFGKYFELTDCDTIPLTKEFYTWFVTVAHAALKPEDRAVYLRMFEQAELEPNEIAKQMLVGKLLEADLVVALSDAAERYQRGEDVDVSKLARAYLEDYEAQVKRKVKLPFVELDDNLFDEDKNNTGFKWRWDCLNLTMRPLRGGDFIVLAGRPDKGKTTALSDNLTYMASQIEQVYPGQNRRILWFNNEGPGKRIMKRVIQSALGISLKDVIELQNKGTLWDEYAACIGGDKFHIQIMDVHGYKSWQIEEILRNVPPALVVFDMIDNIQFDGALINGGQRTDQMLEAMYQWGRDLAVRHDVPVIATSQISAEGDGLAYPTLSMLKDSKTGKQGAADAILVIGAKNEKVYENTRYISLTKNKLHIEGRPKSPHAELILDGPAGRYVEASKEPL